MTDNIRFHRVEPNREEPDDSDVPPELQSLLPYAMRLRSEWDADRLGASERNATPGAARARCPSGPR